MAEKTLSDMPTEKRIALEELMKSVNSERWPSRWNEIYDRVMDDYEKNGCELATPEFYDEIAEKYNILLDYKEYYKRAAVEIAKDDALCRVLCLIAESMKDREQINKDIVELDLPKAQNDEYSFKHEMITALAMCSMLDHTHKLLSEMNLPIEHYNYGMRRCEAMVETYIMRNEGRIGAKSWEWFQLAIDAKLFRIGRLEIELDTKFTKKATVFENARGEIVTLACNAVMHRDGIELGTKNYEDADGSWEAVIDETDDAWVGHCYDERGFAKKEKTVLKKSEWKKIISPRDTVLGLHIPVGVKLTDEGISEDFKNIKRFLNEYFPSFEYKGFVCHSWLMDTQLLDMLGEETNISKFNKRFLKIGYRGQGQGVFMFVFNIGKPKNVILEKLPERTTLERKLKKHYLDGKAIYEIYGFIPKSKL